MKYNYEKKKWEDTGKATMNTCLQKIMDWLET